MPREEQEPEVVDESHTALGGVKFKHPAFGQITVSRISGHTTLYGSDFIHHNYVQVRIYRSEMSRSLSQDWPFAREELISVNMSEAQWAAFVSSFGSGSGVQCTIDHVGCKTAPGIPFRDEKEEFKKEGNEAVTQFEERLKALISDLQSDALGKMTGKQKAVLISRLQAIHGGIGPHLQFIAKSFGEHLEVRFEKAKCEAYAWMNNLIVRSGLQSIAQRDGHPIELIEPPKGEGQ